MSAFEQLHCDLLHTGLYTDKIYDAFQYDSLMEILMAAPHAVNEELYIGVLNIQSNIQKYKLTLQGHSYNKNGVHINLKPRNDISLGANMKKFKMQQDIANNPSWGSGSLNTRGGSAEGSTKCPKKSITSSESEEERDTQYFEASTDINNLCSKV